MENTKISPYLERAREVLNAEATAIDRLSQRLDGGFLAALDLILKCSGHVIVTGMGKSGHIARKIAATLASTGTPAYFIHPAEAAHGDLGMIVERDVVLALSNSGETSEVLALWPTLKRRGVAVISITGKNSSTMARLSDVHLDAYVEQEACALGLAPTTSTAVQLALGDALAVTLMEARGFRKEEFAMFHPGGALGRRLLVHVGDIMHTGEGLPVVSVGTPFKEILIEMTSKSLGMTAVVDALGKLIGVFTDGDLRRTLDRSLDLASVRIEEVMTHSPRTIYARSLASEAAKHMEFLKINGLLVLDDENRLVGALTMHDLLRAGVV